MEEAPRDEPVCPDCEHDVAARVRFACYFDSEDIVRTVTIEGRVVGDVWVECPNGHWHQYRCR